MTYEETTLAISAIAVVISGFAVVISGYSLVRSRKAEKVARELSEKQLARMVDDEEREGQPRFVLHATDIFGADPDQAGYKVKVKFEITNAGDEYMKGSYVTLVMFKDGHWGGYSGAQLEHIDIRERDPILGEQTLLIKPDSARQDCQILVSYVDRYGSDMFQEFDIHLEGHSGDLPSRVIFKYKKTWWIGVSTPWKA